MKKEDLNKEELKELKEIVGNQYQFGPFIGMILNQHYDHPTISKTELIRNVLSLRIETKQAVGLWVPPTGE